MKISVLVENTLASDAHELQAQHGLSLHIETENQQSILFDTGQDGCFAANSSRLGVDLADVDVAVLSHHHFDHGGGLSTFFALNQHAPVYSVKPSGQVCMLNIAGLVKKPIGLSSELFRLHQDRFRFISDSMQVADNIHLFSQIQHQHPLPAGNRLLYVAEHGKLSRDPFAHELLMVVDETDGLVVFTGCAHSGVLNMLASVRRHFPNRKIKGLIGGFHLMGLSKLNLWGASAKNVSDLADTLLEQQIPTIATGHCTGEKAYQRLQAKLGSRLQPLATGGVIEL